MWINIQRIQTTRKSTLSQDSTAKQYTVYVQTKCVYNSYRTEEGTETNYTRIIAAMEPSHKKGDEEKVEANPQVNNTYSRSSSKHNVCRFFLFSHYYTPSVLVLLCSQSWFILIPVSPYFACFYSIYLSVYIIIYIYKWKGYLLLL